MGDAPQPPQDNTQQAPPSKDMTPPPGNQQMDKMGAAKTGSVAGAGGATDQSSQKKDGQQTAGTGDQSKDKAKQPQQGTSDQNATQQGSMDKRGQQNKQGGQTGTTDNLSKTQKDKETGSEKNTDGINQKTPADNKNAQGTSSDDLKKNTDKTNQGSGLKQGQDQKSQQGEMDKMGDETKPGYHNPFDLKDREPLTAEQAQHQKEKNIRDAINKDADAVLHDHKLTMSGVGGGGGRDDQSSLANDQGTNKDVDAANSTKVTEVNSNNEKEPADQNVLKDQTINARNDTPDAGLPPSAEKKASDSADKPEEKDKEKWKNIPSVISSERVISWNDSMVADDQKENCKAHADMQMEVHGFKATHNVFQTIDDKGILHKDEMKKGIDYIQHALESKMPVEVGVDTKQPNQDKFTGNITTNHYIVIVGQGNDSKGNYFTYFDNAYKDPRSVKNTEANRLYYNEKNGNLDRTFEAGSSGYRAMGYYHVSQIRRTKKI